MSEPQVSSALASSFRVAYHVAIMNTSHAHKKFAPGTSRGPRKAATLLAQMADLERGERIRQLREQHHLTQPAVADKVHVTLRAYQGWEAGGGIQWANAKRLAKALGTSPDFIMSGQPHETPDLSLAPSQLEQQMRDLTQAVRLLEEQTRLLRAEAATRDAEVLMQIAEVRRTIRDLRDG